MTKQAAFTLVYTGPRPQDEPPAGGKVVPEAEAADTAAANPWRVNLRDATGQAGIPVKVEPDLKKAKNTPAVLFGGVFYVSPEEFSRLAQYGLDPNGLDDHLRQTCCLNLDAALAAGLQTNTFNLGTDVSDDDLSAAFAKIGQSVPQHRQTIAEATRQAISRRHDPTRRPNQA